MTNRHSSLVLAPVAWAVVLTVVYLGSIGGGAAVEPPGGDPVRRLLLSGRDVHLREHRRLPARRWRIHRSRRHLCRCGVPCPGRMLPAERPLSFSRRVRVRASPRWRLSGSAHAVRGGRLHRGACCFSDGTCVPVSQGPCLVLGGAWHGPESLCVETACPAATPLSGRRDWRRDGRQPRSADRAVDVGRLPVVALMIGRGNSSWSAGPFVGLWVSLASGLVLAGLGVAGGWGRGLLRPNPFGPLAWPRKGRRHHRRRCGGRNRVGRRASSSSGGPSCGSASSHGRHCSTARDDRDRGGGGRDPVVRDSASTVGRHVMGGDGTRPRRHRSRGCGVAARPRPLGTGDEAGGRARSRADRLSEVQARHVRPAGDDMPGMRQHLHDR